MLPNIAIGAFDFLIYYCSLFLISLSTHSRGCERQPAEGSIRKMIQQDKGYPELMDKITKVHGELENIEKVIVEDLAEPD